MVNTEESHKSSKSKIDNFIVSVSTPLRLFALLVLSIEAILVITAKSALGADRTYLIVGLIAVLMLMILSVTLLELKRIGPELKQIDPKKKDAVESLMFKDNDCSKFLQLFQEYFDKAHQIQLVGTGFNVLQRDAFRILLTQRIESNRELKIYAANPFSPNVQTRLIEEEIGNPAPRIGQQGLITWLRDLLNIHHKFNQPSNFSLKLFPYYPTYAMFIFDKEDYFFYPYGFAQLGTLSPILHLSKKNKEHTPMVEFLDKQFKFISECSTDADIVWKIHDGQRVEASCLTAFAVYLIPPAGSELYKFGSKVLCYDVRTSKKLQANDWSKSIGAASDFGFHLTVADALYCTHPKDVDLICREVEFLARQIRPFSLKLQLKKDFPNQEGIALVCKDESGSLESMHHEMVAHIYRKAVASNYSNSLGSIARPDRDPNKQRARFMIQRYHAPYILQSYQPHFSLLSAVRADNKEQLFADMQKLYEEYKVESEIQIHAIAVMHRPNPAEPWQIFHEYRLGGI